MPPPPPEVTTPPAESARASLPGAGAVITRFAPSPTGELHVGGARTALYAWAYARRHGGTFLLRFEDTDQKRSSKQAERNILRDLLWLGLKPDNVGDVDPAPGNDPASFDAALSDVPRQSTSEKLERYRAAVEELKAKGLAYDDNGAVRFRMNKPVSFVDAVYGPISVEAKDLEDFVILKAPAPGPGSDRMAFPTFHLAVVVDDFDTNVTHVIRGQEHLSNTAKHAALCDALGYPRPIWCHTPSILNPDGSKMSKRDKGKVSRKAAEAAKIENTTVQGWGIDASTFTAFMNKENDELFIAEHIAMQLGISLPEINVADFQRSGYPPEVLLNYLALLGWNPGENLEKFTRDEMAARFDFERIGKSNSKFDREKLAAFSQDAILQMPPEVFVAKLQAHFEAYFPEEAATLGDGFALFAGMYRERSKTLSDPDTLGVFFFHAPSEYDDKAVKKNLTKNEGEGLKALRAVRDALGGLSDWTAETIHAALDALWPTPAVGGKNMGAVAQPLRVAITGTAVSPEIGPTLQLLGREETLRRIDACLAAVRVG